MKKVKGMPRTTKQQVAKSVINRVCKEKAMECVLVGLVEAFERGEAGGGSVCWSELEDCYRAAKSCLAM